jgi:hypothetical protein
MRNNMLDTDGIKSTFTSGYINIYTGSQPATADDAVPGTAVLLAIISNNGTATGVTFDAPVAGKISKAAAETWSDTALATGSAGWFRLYRSADNPATSDTTLARIDGAVSTSGAELNISNTSVVIAAVQTVTQFDITMPAA